MKPSSIFAILILLISIPAIAISQSQRFNVGLTAGLNDTPILLYRKGINAGLVATSKINERHSLRLEILITQNGDNILHDDIPTDKAIRHAFYAELPLYFDWKWNIFDESDHVELDFVFNAGIAYTRSVAVFVEDLINQSNQEQIKVASRNGALVKSGVIFLIAKRYGLNINASLPIRTKEIHPTYSFRLLFML